MSIRRLCEVRSYALFGLRPLYLLILSFGLINGASGSMLIEKSKGLRQSPSPLLKVKKSEQHLFTLTHDFGLVYISLTQSTDVEWKPMAAGFLYQNCQFTLSNTLCASKLISILFCMFFFTHLIMFSVLLMLVAPCVPGMKPVWSR